MKAWHFVRESRKLGYDDNRLVKTGRTYKIPKDKPLELCNYGLHGSKRIIDALKYAPGPVVCRVELIGKIIHDDDTSVAYERKVIWMRDISKELRHFARLCALDVIHLWDAPDVVRHFLKTGDESIRDAAWYAVRAAARDAASDAAWAAARDATWSAARGAARAAAWAAAGSAAGSAAWDAQNKRLTKLVKEWNPIGGQHENSKISS